MPTIDTPDEPGLGADSDAFSGDIVDVGRMKPTRAECIARAAAALRAEIDRLRSQRPAA